jgi:hypothetical protein
MKTYVVQLEDHDDVISARDKISWSKARRILLLWPPKGRVLERRIDLLLLQRHSQHLGAQLALVTRSSAVRVQAGELGIPIFEDAAEAQEASWRRIRGRRKLARQKMRRSGAKPAAAGVLREQRLAERQASQADLFSRAAEILWVRVGVFTLAVLSFLVMALGFVPGAEVHLKPFRQPQQMTIAVWADPEIHAPNASGGLPSQSIVVTVEGRDQANSTGQASIPNQYATGQVVLSNLTDQVVDVPEGSILLGMASPEVDFHTRQAVQVPAGPGKSVMVDVRAALPGSTGNLPAGKIQAMQGPAGLRLAVSNPSGTRGGGDQVSPAPTEQDYHALREKLLANLQTSALEEMRTRLKPGSRLLDGTIHVHSTVSETREPVQGQPGDELQLTMQVVFEAWTVEKVDLQAVAQAALDVNRGEDFQPVPGSLNIAFATDPRLEQVSDGGQAGNAAGSSTSLAAQPEALRARWNLKIERVLEASWGKAGVISLIQGKGVQEAQRTLEANLRLAETPQIQLYPGWWNHLPFLPARIRLVTE